MRAISNIFGAKQYSYIFPYLTEGMDTSHEYDECIDLGGHSILNILNTNIKAKKYTLITSSIIIKRLYDALFTIKLNKDNYYKVANRINVHNNRLVFSFCHSVHHSYGKINTPPSDLETMIYRLVLFEYVCRPSFRMLQYTLLYNHICNYFIRKKWTEERIENYKIFKTMPKLWRILDNKKKEMIWNEIEEMMRLISNSSKRIVVKYIPSNKIYSELLREKMYSKNVCFISVFSNSIKGMSRKYDLNSCRPVHKPFFKKDTRILKFYKKCTAYNTPFIFSMVYKLGKKIYYDLDDFIYYNKVRYRMYLGTHNKSHIMIADNLDKIGGKVYYYEKDKIKVLRNITMEEIEHYYYGKFKE